MILRKTLLYEKITEEDSLLAINLFYDEYWILIRDEITKDKALSETEATQYNMYKDSNHNRLYASSFYDP